MEITDKYGMFSDEGNAMVYNALQKVLKLKVTASDQDIYDLLKREMQVIETAGHDEVYDTEVRERMIFAIEKATGRELSIYFCF